VGDDSREQITVRADGALKGRGRWRWIGVDPKECGALWAKRGSLRRRRRWEYEIVVANDKLLWHRLGPVVDLGL
jgi:hypothetical protein